MLKKFLNAAIMYLSMLSVRSEHIWIFGAWFGEKFSDNSKYFFLHMQSNKSIKSIWISKNKKVVEELRQNGFRAYMHNSIPGIWFQLRAKYVFICCATSDVNEYVIGNAYIVNLQHGTGGKKAGYADHINTRSAFNTQRVSLTLRKIPQRRLAVVATSYSMTDYVMEAFRIRDNQVLHVGFARNDVFYNTFSNDVSKEFRINNDYILYLPTHRQEGRQRFDIESLMDLNKLNQLFRRYNKKFIIKKHFYHSKEGTTSRTYSNIIDLTGTEYDTQLLMKNASMLITDYSSCYVDYLLLDRPVGFYCFDLYEYQKNDRELVFSYDDTTPGFKAFTFDEFYDQLERFLSSGEDSFKKERLRVRKIFYDDYACQEVTPILEEKVLSGEIKRMNKRRI